MSNDKHVDYDKLSGLQLFWHFPGEWWNRKHWLARIFYIAIYTTLVSAVSVAMYSAKHDREMVRLQEIERQQIGELNKVIDEVKNERSEVLGKREDKVLTEIGDLQDQLRLMREQASTLSNTQFSDSIEEALAALEASPSADY